MEVEELPGAPGVIRVGELGPGRAEMGLGMSSPSKLVEPDLPGCRSLHLVGKWDWISLHLVS